MAEVISQKEATQIKLTQKYRVVYERKEMLGGWISWEVVAKKDSVGKDLIINTKEHYDNIFLNGKKLNP